MPTSSACAAVPPTAARAPRRPRIRPRRFGTILVLVSVGTAVVTAIPTELIANPWFTRMTEPQAYAYPVWLASAILCGLLAALQWGTDATMCPTGRVGPLGATGALGSFLAVGCPVCNKLVVLALGASGAVSYFAPLQPWLAGLALLVLAIAVGLRLRRIAGHRVGTDADVPAPAS